jgi:anti-sigma factor RsiW
VTMQCRDARELLDSFIGEELLVETNHELLGHLAACPDCSAELDVRRRIRSGLKQAFRSSPHLQPRPRFTEEVTARLRASIQPARRRWRSRWLPIAASLLVLAGASNYFLRGRPSEVARLAAGDHQNCAVSLLCPKRRFRSRKPPNGLTLPTHSSRRRHRTWFVRWLGHSTLPTGIRACSGAGDSATSSFVSTTISCRCW